MSTLSYAALDALQAEFNVGDPHEIEVRSIALLRQPMKQGHIAAAGERGFEAEVLSAPRLPFDFFKHQPSSSDRGRLRRER